MTTLGFRAVHAGDVKRLCQNPGGVAELNLATLPEAERQQELLTHNDDVESIPYTRWAPAHGERSAREHLAARRAELQQHVIDVLYEPDGKSHVAQLARCILCSPIPELPAQPAPALPTPERSERNHGNRSRASAGRDVCVSSTEFGVVRKCKKDHSQLTMGSRVAETRFRASIRGVGASFEYSI